MLCKICAPEPDDSDLAKALGAMADALDTLDQRLRALENVSRSKRARKASKSPAEPIDLPAFLGPRFENGLRYSQAVFS